MSVALNSITWLRRVCIAIDQGRTTASSARPNIFVRRTTSVLPYIPSTGCWETYLIAPNHAKKIDSTRYESLVSHDATNESTAGAKLYWRPIGSWYGLSENHTNREAVFLNHCVLLTGCWYLFQDCCFTTNPQQSTFHDESKQVEFELNTSYEVFRLICLYLRK